MTPIKNDYDLPKIVETHCHPEFLSKDASPHQPNRFETITTLCAIYVKQNFQCVNLFRDEAVIKSGNKSGRMWQKVAESGRK